MILQEEIHQQLSFLGKSLVTKILDISSIHEIKAETEILKEGQFVTSLPIILKGLFNPK